MPTTLNTLTGKIANVPQSIAEHPVVGKYLKVVSEGTKPLVPGMFKPGTVEEFDSQKPIPAQENADKDSSGDK